MLRHGRGQVQEERAWGMWLAAYPHMTKQNFVPFERWYRRKAAEPAEGEGEGRAVVTARAERIKLADQEG